MQAKKRYALLICTVCFVIVLYVGVKLSNSLQDDGGKRPIGYPIAYKRPKSVLSADEQLLDRLSNFLDQDDTSIDEDVRDPKDRLQTIQNVYKGRKCRMDSCFDFNRCRQHGFKVYVYPLPKDEKVSQNYKNILDSVRNSRYYTSNPEEACLFILGYDTLDRDIISPDYISNLGSKISRLKYWNNGRNHLIFTLYTGTWPDYLEDLGFNVGEAMLAKASFSKTHFRDGFDVSLPLFGKKHPLMSGDTGHLKRTPFPPFRKYMLSFKGKRYTHGIGSNTRNSLYHIHNGDDIIMVTTCKHGKSWQKNADSRCYTDNAHYDRWDYEELLHNSTFCVVPRGRRLGSFRFLESLQAGCIPLVLANGWQLPFEEVIDWRKAAIRWEERLLLQVPSMIREITVDDIMLLKQQSQFLWNKYFSSVSKIVQSTLEIVHDRIYPELTRPSQIWNSEQGSAAFLPSYSTELHDYPSQYNHIGHSVPKNFTAVIHAISPVTSSAAPIVKLVRMLSQAEACAQIIILWHCDKAPPANSRWPVDSPKRGKLPISVIRDSPRVIGRRFLPFQQIKSDVIFSLDEDTVLNTDEINFSFGVWRTFPDRIVGFPARSHVWDENHSKISYTSKWQNSYSIILTGAAFIHKYYLALYSEWLPESIRNEVNELGNCEDILMNYLVAYMTKLPPIKVTQKKQYKDTSAIQQGQPKSVQSKWADPKHFTERQDCMNKFAKVFGEVPLSSSQVRYDPTLYKDNVAIVRKRYPKTEI